MKNFVFLICLALLGTISIIPQTVQASNVTHQLSDQPTAYEKYLVCCELDAQRILDLETAIALERRGLLTIEKTGSGVYRATTSGISIFILISEN